MKKSKLGLSSLDVSKVCLGTMTFGEQNSQDESFDQMNYAFEKGINFFDTAEMYPIPGRKSTQGKTERIIGRWLEETGNREEICLATKITGYGVILNTSFNENEPIVDTPDQAIDCFLRTDMDVLFLEKFMIRKN